jgi:hypothetical protein
MISRICTWATLAVLPLIAASCSVDSPTTVYGDLGRRFTATVPGTWAGEYSYKGIQVQMIKQFNTDGTARGVLITRQKSGNVSLVLPEVPFKSRWRVKGDVVETYDVKTGVPGLFESGEVIRDTLISISQDRIVSRSNKSGGIEIITRSKSVRE